MKRLARHPAGDLLAVLILALAALLALVLPIPDPVRAVVVAPLALLLPGYALTAAIFPPAAIDRGLRVILTVVCTMSVISLGGLVLQTVVSLDTAVYAGLLLVSTAGFVAVALRRRATGPAVPALRSRLPRVGIGPVAGFAIALVLAGAAIAVATSGQHRQLEHERFTALWILPRGTGNDFSATVGLQNEEGSTRAYELRVAQNGRPIRRWRVRLGAGQEWEGSLAASAIVGEAPVIASLYREGLVYRRVALHPGGEA